MRNKTREGFANIDIGDLFDMSKRHSIKNFYLSHLELKDSFFKEGTSFVFNGFYISLCLSGHCDMRISGRNYRAGAGSLIVLAPNQLIETGSLSRDFDSRAGQ